jgi:hypothetical protein
MRIFKPTNRNLQIVVYEKVSEDYLGHIRSDWDSVHGARPFLA